MLPTDPRKLQKAMKRLGIRVQPVEAEEVLIKCSDKEIAVKNPEVSRMKIKGQEILQIQGKLVERLAIKAKDIKMVAKQAQVSKKKAKKALEKTGGDLAKAIMELKQ